MSQLSINATYNILINRFKTFADGHYQIHSFSHGQIDMADLMKDNLYPFMHVVPSTFTYPRTDSGGVNRAITFRVFFADLPRDKSTKAAFQREVISDMELLARDLLAEIRNGNIFGSDILWADAAADPFIEEFSNVLTGVELTLTLILDWQADACNIPADFSNIPSGIYPDVNPGGTIYMLKSVYDPNNIGNPVVFSVNGELPDATGDVTVATGAATVVRTTAGWVTNGTQVLASGQAGFDSELLLTKIGDGVTTYANLEYDHATQLHETSANFAVSNPVLAHGQIAIEQDTLKMKVGDEFGTAYNSLPYIVQDANIVFTDVTTNNASTSAHGFLKKLDNTATNFLDGTGNWDSVKDSDLSTSDITTNDVTTAKHGFTPKAPNNDNQYLTGLGTWLYERHEALMIAQMMGATSYLFPVNSGPSEVGISSALADTRNNLVAAWLPRAATLTGVGWYQSANGNYTADNYNGVGLYSYSAGVLTLVASSTDDGNIWKPGSTGWKTKGFTTPYVAAAGLYFIAALYNSSVQVTAPSLGGLSTMQAAGVALFPYADSAKAYGNVAGSTAFGDPINMTAVSGTNTRYFLYCY